MSDTLVRLGLQSHNFAPTYRKGDTDIASEFLVPCFRSALTYDRAVGYFSSTAYAVAWDGLRDFLSNGGVMRVLCSPRVSDTDARSLQAGHNRRAVADLDRTLSAELDAMLASTEMQDPAIVLATLVATKRLDLRFVDVTHDSTGRFLFHDKAGLFSDAEGNSVLFKGSMNETWSGVASDGNLESIDVFVSWTDDREALRVAEHQGFFDSLWLGLWPAASVYSIPEAFHKRLLSLADADHLDHRITSIVQRSARKCATSTSPPRSPLRHQAQAIINWSAAGRRGILEHATGSGKTFTALLAIKDALQRGETPIVLVPSVLLLSQWEREARLILGEDTTEIVSCGAGNDLWRTPGVLAAWTRPTVKPRLILATMDTAASEQFRARVRGGPHIFLIADEVHRVGSPQRSRALEIAAGPRLGLSATPIRAGDADGTRQLLQWFGPIVKPCYGLGDAIRDGRLSRYFYKVHTARLSHDELAEWNRLTTRLAALRRAHTTTLESATDLEKSLLIERARILKQAGDKLTVALRVLGDTVREGDRWLVYCDSIQQLQSLRLRLGTSLPCKVFEYFRGMPGDGTSTLRLFAEFGGVILSIRCLDEGVDIPAADHALIIASSQNPREFIQRRGRVLRHSPRKAFADIHDLMVLPPTGHALSREYPFIHAEIARAAEFARHAENPAEIDRLRAILAEEGVSADAIKDLGTEDDGDEGTDGRTND